MIWRLLYRNAEAEALAPALRGRRPSNLKIVLLNEEIVAQIPSPDATTH